MMMLRDPAAEMRWPIPDLPVDWSSLGSEVHIVSTWRFYMAMSYLLTFGGPFFLSLCMRLLRRPQVHGSWPWGSASQGELHFAVGGAARRLNRLEIVSRTTSNHGLNHCSCFWVPLTVTFQEHAKSSGAKAKVRRNDPHWHQNWSISHQPTSAVIMIMLSWVCGSMSTRLQVVPHTVFDGDTCVLLSRRQDSCRSHR